MIQRRMSLGMFLVVCGLLWQLRDPANWLVALPIFALFYGVPLLGGDWTLSRVFDRQWWLGQVRPFFVRLSRYRPALPRRTQPARWRLHVCTRELCMTLVLLLLPFAIELLIEDLVFEGLLRM